MTADNWIGALLRDTDPGALGRDSAMTPDEFYLAQALHGIAGIARRVQTQRDILRFRDRTRSICGLNTPALRATAEIDGNGIIVEQKVWLTATTFPYYTFRPDEFYALLSKEAVGHVIVPNHSNPIYSSNLRFTLLCVDDLYPRVSGGSSKIIACGALILNYKKMYADLAEKLKRVAGK